MAANLLAGSGPSPQMSGSADGPAPGIQGTVGATPQASPTIGAPNMLAGGGMRPQGAPMTPQAPIAPPSFEKLQEAYHKQGYMVAALKSLLGEPDLSSKDILNEVGESVAEGIIGPFDAAGYLKDLPPGDDSLQLRQWVGQHYANAMKSMQTISEMLAAHGQMTQRQTASPPQAAMAPSPMQNAFQPSAPGA